MKQKKIISLPTNPNKVYRQILAFMNFMLNLTPQEQDVLAILLKLDNEYEALPEDKRGRFILSTDMRKEARTSLNIEEKQFNILLGKLKKKTLFNKPLISEQGIIHPELRFKPDSDGFKIEVNLVMTAIKHVEKVEDKEEIPKPITPTLSEPSTISTPPKEYQYDASKAPIIEEEKFDFTLNTPDA